MTDFYLKVGRTVMLYFLLSATGIERALCQMDTIINVYFKTNSDSLMEKELRKLDGILTGNYAIKSIIGHADSVGAAEYNLKLSKRRALYVAKYLMRGDGSQNKFTVCFFGEENSNFDRDISFDRRVIVLAEHHLFAAGGKSTETIESQKIPGDNEITRRNFQNIYFVPDKPIIDPESFAAVEDLVRYVESFKNAHFEIRGHVNLARKKNVDDKFYQDMENLSTARAKVIYSILVERGISPERLTYKGVGNRQMLYPDAKTEAEMRKNMRVEIIVKE